MLRASTGPTLYPSARLCSKNLRQPIPLRTRLATALSAKPSLEWPSHFRAKSGAPARTHALTRSTRALNGRQASDRYHAGPLQPCPPRITSALVPTTRPAATPRLQQTDTMASALLESYKQWAHGMDVMLMDWVDPTLRYRLSPMQDYFLADFGTVFALCVGYLTFVVVGTLVMKSGMPALNTAPLQFIYNPIQVVLCSYMTVEAILQARRNDYSATPCNAFNHENPVMGNLMYIFYLSKVLDFCDTFFIVMGKKWKQLSVLHVYHHVTVFFCYWANFRTSYDGDLYMTIVLNGGVHAIMYMYYFVSSHTRKIWWKPYLTTVQMIQFLLMNAQGYLMVSRSCPGMPYKISVMYLIYVQSLFWLFMNFFVVNYCLSSRKPKTVEADKKTL